MKEITVELIEKTLDIYLEPDSKSMLVTELKFEQGRDHEFVIATHPGIGFFVSSLEEDKIAEERLNDLAETAWPGEGSWPFSDGDYTAYVLNMKNRTIESIAGECSVFYTL